MEPQKPTPSAKDTNSPVCNDSEKDANEVEMMSQQTIDGYYEFGCWAGNAQETIHKLVDQVVKVQAKLEEKDREYADLFQDYVDMHN